MKKFILIFFAALLWSTSLAFSSSTITWVASGAGNWSNGANWSGGVAPGNSDFAVFSASSTQNVAIDISVNVAGISIGPGYTGTITQSAGKTITVGTSGFSQSSGAFAGDFSGANITDKGSFILTGGTFTSTAGDLALWGGALTWSNSFQNNSGTVTLSATTSTFPASSTFYNLEFYPAYGDNGSGYQSFTIPTGTVLTVQNDLMMSADYSYIQLLGGGEINVQGNIDGGNFAHVATSTASVALTGTGTQIINTTNGYSLNGSLGSSLVLPSFSIQKSSGSVVLQNQFSVEGNWTDSHGIPVNAGTSTVTFTANAGSFPASSTFYNLEFYPAYGDNGSGYQSFTIPTGTVLTVQNDLMMSADYSYIQLLGGGEINVQGNIDGGNFAHVATSTASVALTGTGTQIINTTNGYSLNGSLGSSLVLPSFSIQKSSGSVVLQNQFSVEGNWTDSHGIPVNAGTSTVTFTANAGSFPASSTFYNLEFYPAYGDNGSGYQSFTIPTGTVLTVQNDLMMSADYSYIQLLGGGEINVQGNIDGGNFAHVATSTASVALTGTGTQIINTTNGYSLNGFYGSSLVLPSLVVEKPGGVAYVENSPIISSNLSVLQGEFRLATSSSATKIQIDGTTSVSSSSILSDYPTASSTVVFGGGVTNNGLIFFDGNVETCSAVPPQKVIINSTTTNQQVPWSGSGIFIIRYTQVADQGGTTPITVWNGTSLGSDVGSNWTFSSGNPEPELVQNSVASGGAGTTQLTLSAFGFQPRSGDLILVAVSARNQTIATPTDNAGNTYTLVASSPFGTSPSYALSLYYAKNITTTSSLIVTAHGNGGTSPYLSASAFEYTGIAESSTYDTSSANIDTSGSAVSLTSLGANGQSSNELYFGVMTLDASTTASSSAGWTAEAGVTNNNSTQALYAEDMALINPVVSAATWTSATSTDYAAIMGIFKSPTLLGYEPEGTLDSATFDTGVPNGAQFNSLVWQGSEPSGSSIGFQLAVSNVSNGSWNFIGPDGTANTYFSGNPGTPISLIGTINNYVLFTGNRYFRYRVTLFSDSSRVYTPTVSQVSVNWSP